VSAPIDPGRLFLIDASVYIFRAHRAGLEWMMDRDGQPVSAIFGFARFLGELLERVRPKYLGVAFDQRSSRSYRCRLYPAYKAHREPAPAELRVQIERCRELCDLLGLPTFVSPEYEADDLIGTLAWQMREEGLHAAFITRDKDLAQLMRDGDIYWDYGDRAPLGYGDVERRFGVRPESFADYLALTGDDSDNIPGVPGIGPATAAKLMKHFGSVDALFGDLPRVATLKLRGAALLAATLAKHKETVYLARQLTRIVCDIPLTPGREGLQRRLPDVAALTELYDSLGFGPVLRRQAERLAELPLG
jgi:5'-3' exonuclease